MNACNFITGRAGRYGSVWETGYVTAFKPEDLTTLKLLLAQSPEPVSQAGLYPTAEQMELYAYHLPHASLSSLMVSFYLFYFLKIVSVIVPNISFSGYIRSSLHSRRFAVFHV